MGFLRVPAILKPMKSKRLFTYLLAGLFVVVLAGFLFREQIMQYVFKPTGSAIHTEHSNNHNMRDVEVIAGDLTVPWGVAFLPGGDLLVTERSGTLRRVGQNKQVHAIEGVTHVGEGGLLGLALDPNFSSNNRIYLYMTTKTGNALTNRIERYNYADNKLINRTVILQNIPGEANHDGGRLAFGPDGYLYVTTGDAGNPTSAQDRNSLAGKILRLNTDGQPAPKNPFNNAVYSYGHRNPQGLAWDDRGQLWSSEHGRSGIQSGFDEINLIKPGANYGWPTIQGDAAQVGMEKPVAHSGSSETWAPASLAYADGSLYFGGLRGETLYQAKISSNNALTLEAHYRGEYGRIRTVAIQDKLLYMTTSNTDGRGEPKPSDDKVVRIKLSTFR